MKQIKKKVGIVVREKTFEFDILVDSGKYDKYDSLEDMNINMLHTDYPEELLQIGEEIHGIAKKIEHLRKKYHSDGKIPMFQNNSEFENLMKMVDYLDEEILKYIGVKKVIKVHNYFKDNKE